MIVYFLLFNGAYFYWSGGWSTGPRHLTPALPFACLGLAWVWNCESRWVKVAMAVLIGTSFITSLMAVSATMFASNDPNEHILAYLVRMISIGELEGLAIWYRPGLSLSWLPWICLPLITIWIIGAVYIRHRIASELQPR